MVVRSMGTLKRRVGSIGKDDVGVEGTSDRAMDRSSEAA